MHGMCVCMYACMHFLGKHECLSECLYKECITLHVCMYTCMSACTLIHEYICVYDDFLSTESVYSCQNVLPTIYDNFIIFSIVFKDFIYTQVIIGNCAYTDMYMEFLRIFTL